LVKVEGIVDRRAEFLPLGINTQDWKSGLFFDTDPHRQKKT
jgi:hypothetical protein